MEHVAGKRVSPGKDGDAGFMERLEQAEHRRERFTVSGFLVLRRLERATAHDASHLRRKARDNVFQAGRDRGRIAAEKTFERHERRIENGVVLLEEIDELAHLRFVRAEFAGTLGHLDEPVAITRFFHFGEQEVEHDEIEVLN
jgi:hypothetical protein